MCSMLPQFFYSCFLAEDYSYMLNLWCNPMNLLLTTSFKWEFKCACLCTFEYPFESYIPAKVYD